MPQNRLRSYLLLGLAFGWLLLLLLVYSQSCEIDELAKQLRARPPAEIVALDKPPRHLMGAILDEELMKPLPKALFSIEVPYGNYVLFVELREARK